MEPPVCVRAGAAIGFGVLSVAPAGLLGLQEGPNVWITGKHGPDLKLKLGPNNPHRFTSFLYFFTIIKYISIWW